MDFLLVADPGLVMLLSCEELELISSSSSSSSSKFMLLDIPSQRHSQWLSTQSKVMKKSTNSLRVKCFSVSHLVICRPTEMHLSLSSHPTASLNNQSSRIRWREWTLPFFAARVGVGLNILSSEKLQPLWSRVTADVWHVPFFSMVTRRSCLLCDWVQLMTGSPSLSSPVEWPTVRIWIWPSSSWEARPSSAARRNSIRKQLNVVSFSDQHLI